MEEDKIDLARELMAQAGDKLMLPVDHVVAAELKVGVDTKVGRSGTRGPDGLDTARRRLKPTLQVSDR